MAEPQENEVPVLELSDPRAVPTGARRVLCRSRLALIAIKLYAYDSSFSAALGVRVMNLQLVASIISLAAGVSGLVLVILKMPSPPWIWIVISLLGVWAAFLTVAVGGLGVAGIRRLLSTVKRAGQAWQGLDVVTVLERVALPVAGVFFIASMYFGWQFTPVLVFELSQGGFDYRSPSLNLYVLLQWQYFLYGLISLAAFFLFRAARVAFGGRGDWKRYVAVGGLIAIAVGFVFWNQSVEYSRTFGGYGQDTSQHSHTAEPAAVKAPASQGVKKQATPKSGATGGAAATPHAEKKDDTQLNAEALTAFKDLNKYLLDWAILLLTGISVILARELGVILGG